MLKEKWCENFSKPLAIFNKAFIRRVGKGLHPYIVMAGNEDECRYCAKMEAKLFFENGIYESDEVYDLKTDITIRGVYLEMAWDPDHEKQYQSIAENGSILIFMSGDVKRANHYDIAGCMKYSFKEQFLSFVGMQCEEDLFDTILDKYPDIVTMDIETVANNTVLCHYENSDDDVILVKDFDWLCREDEQDADEVPKLKAEEQAKEKQTAEKTTESDERQPKKEKKENATPVATIEKVPEKQEKAVDKKLSDMTAPVTPPRRPATKPAKKKRNQYGLTEEDERYNAELLTEVRAEYESLLEYIKSLKASIWKPIERLVESSLETNEYDESIILKYLEISQDVTTDLYERLYEKTEPVRRKLLDEVKRKYKNLVCYNCSSKWKVDITFMDKEHDESECPTCGASVGYDKN